jgi:hypothetical protein
MSIGHRRRTGYQSSANSAAAINCTSRPRICGTGRRRRMHSRRHFGQTTMAWQLLSHESTGFVSHPNPTTRYPVATALRMAASVKQSCDRVWADHLATQPVRAHRSGFMTHLNPLYRVGVIAFANLVSPPCTPRSRLALQLPFVIVKASGIILAVHRPASAARQIEATVTSPEW